MLHFFNGVFTHKGGDPLPIRIDIRLSLTGKSNDVVEVRIIKEDALAVITELIRVPITIQGTTGQGKAENATVFTTDLVILDDKIRYQVRNTSGTSDITTADGSNSIIQAK